MGQSDVPVESYARPPEIELKALEITQMRVVAEAARNGGNPPPNPASSILKIKGSELQQTATELLFEGGGRANALAAPYDGHGDDRSN